MNNYDLNQDLIDADQVQLQNPKLQPGKISASAAMRAGMAPYMSAIKDSPERKTSPVKGQGRVITDNEARLVEVLDENQALEQLYAQKKEEQEKLHFKHQKAQSEFLDIMRELSRFRSEFFDNCSIRSKLQSIMQIHLKIEQSMEMQGEVLRDQ